MLYPIVVELAGRDVLVVGGGRVAARKVATLLDVGAAVRVIARETSEQISQWAAAGKLELTVAEFDAKLLGEPALVFAATDEPKTNDRVVAAARRRGCLANSAAGEELDFVLPAVHRAGELGHAVWSGSPALSKRLRDELGAHVDERWALAADVFAALRIAMQGRGTSDERGTLWRNLAAGAPQEFRTHAVAKRFVRAIAKGAGLPLGQAELEALFEVAEH